MLPSYTMMRHDGSWGLEPHARTPRSYCRSHLDCRKVARFSLWKTKHRKVGTWNILDIIGIGRYHLYHPGKHFWGGCYMIDHTTITTAILGQTDCGGGVRSQSVLVERGFRFRHFFGAVLVAEKSLSKYGVCLEISYLITHPYIIIISQFWKFDSHAILGSLPQHFQTHPFCLWGRPWQAYGSVWNWRMPQNC